MPYLINGSSASLVPMRQIWKDSILGYSLDGQTYYDSNKEVTLEFDSCSLSHYQQWANVTSGGSLNTMTILAPDSLAYVAYSGIFLDFIQRPAIESGLAMGMWSILVREVAA